MSTWEEGDCANGRGMNNYQMTTDVLDQLIEVDDANGEVHDARYRRPISKWAGPGNRHDESRVYA